MLEAKILSDYRSNAVVGESANPERPSYRVASYLIGAGYQVYPVNPNTVEILRQPSYPSLSSIPEPVEVVNIFRRSQDVMPITDEAIKVGAEVVWMQPEVINEKAAAKARDASLLVVMNICTREEHQHLREKVN